MSWESTVVVRARKEFFHLFLEQFFKNLSIVWVVRQLMIHDFGDF